MGSVSAELTAIFLLTPFRMTSYCKNHGARRVGLRLDFQKNSGSGNGALFLILPLPFFQE